MITVQQLIKAGLSESYAQAVFDTEKLIVTGAESVIDTAIVAATSPLIGAAIAPVANHFIEAGIDSLENKAIASAPGFFENMLHKVTGN